MENLRKGEWIAASVLLLCIAVLLLVSSTDFFLKEAADEIYTIAFITDDGEEDMYMKFKMGMDKAAEKWNVDIVSDVSEANRNAKEQERAVLEAVESGAQAVIIAPVDSRGLAEFMEKRKMNIPIISLDEGVGSENEQGTFLYDSELAGKELAGAVIEDYRSGVIGRRILLYAEKSGKEQTVLCMEALADTLAAADMEVVRKQYMQGIPLEEGVVVAVDAYTLGKIISQKELPEDLYGVGSSNQVIAMLGDGKIRAAAVGNEYDRGYLSVEAAVKSIRSGIRQQTVKLESVILRPEDVHKEQYEGRLFPIG